MHPAFESVFESPLPSPAGVNLRFHRQIDSPSRTGVTQLARDSFSFIRRCRHLSARCGDAEFLQQLLAGGHWDELSDRFYKTLEFGTGGLRGRTIGKIVTKAERGNAGADERPQFPCVGTNAMNFANVNRATQGLVAYAKEWHAKNK